MPSSLISATPKAPPRVKTRRLVDRPFALEIVFALVVAAVGGIYLISAGGNFPLDDGWIHQTFARNLAQRGEWAFIAGVPSAASTSPLYTLVLSIGYVLGIEGRVWAHLLGALALFGTGALGAHMTRRILPHAPWVALLGGLALIGNWHIVWGAFSGMETGIFQFLTLVIIALCWLDTAPVDTPLAADRAWRAVVWRGLRFGLFAGLITLTRPEGVLLVGMAGLAFLASRRWSFAQSIAYGVCAVLVFAAVLAPYLQFNLALTGGLLPNTAAAKMAYAQPFLALPYTRRIMLLLEPLFAGGHLLLLPGVLLFVVFTLRRIEVVPRLIPTLLLIAWPIGLVMLYAAQLPLPFQHARYLIPALPAFILAGVIGMEWALARWRRGLLRRVALRVLALSCVLVTGVFLFFIGRQAYTVDVAIIDQEMVEQAKFIAANIPPEELLVIHDIGAVGFFAPRPLLDVAGLASPDMIGWVGDPAAQWALIREREGRWLMAFQNQIPRPLAPGVRLCVFHETTDAAVMMQGDERMILYRIVYDGECPPGERSFIPPA
jgi:hypothetical protein